MKILFVCRKFEKVAGGVERMATAMMNEMARRGHCVSLLTFDRAEAEPYYPLDAAVEWLRTGIGDPDFKASWRERWERQKSIRRHAVRFAPDVIIGFQNGAFLAARTAVIGLGIPVIAAERNSLDRYDYLSFSWRRYIDFPAFLLARRVTVQMESYIGRYPAYLRGRIVAIPNPVTPVSDVPYPNEQENYPKIILNVGRLSQQKNQEFLVRVFVRLAPRYPGWRLVLVGDGGKDGALRAAVAAAGVQDRVVFTGAVKDVGHWYRQASFLAFPSLWEGFPNVLAEAFSFGVPAAGFRTTAGVNEMIVEGVTGLLSAPTEESFAEAMTRMIDDLPMRRKMGRAAAKAARAYEPSKIFDEWEDLFRSVGARA